jgi:hypothetical protein
MRFSQPQVSTVEYTRKALQKPPFFDQGIVPAEDLYRKDSTGITKEENILKKPQKR